MKNFYSYDIHHGSSWSSNLEGQRICECVERRKKTRRQNNKINAFMLACISGDRPLGCLVLNDLYYGKTLFPQGCFTGRRKIDLMLYITIGVTGVVLLLHRYYFSGSVSNTRKRWKKSILLPRTTINSNYSGQPFRRSSSQYWLYLVWNIGSKLPVMLPKMPLLFRSNRSPVWTGEPLPRKRKCIG